MGDLNDTNFWSCPIKPLAPLFCSIRALSQACQTSPSFPSIFRKLHYLILYTPMYKGRSLLSLRPVSSQIFVKKVSFTAISDCHRQTESSLKSTHSRFQSLKWLCHDHTSSFPMVTGRGLPWPNILCYAQALLTPKLIRRFIWPSIAKCYTHQLLSVVATKVKPRPTVKFFIIVITLSKPCDSAASNANCEGGAGNGITKSREVRWEMFRRPAEVMQNKYLITHSLLSLQAVELFDKSDTDYNYLAASSPLTLFKYFSIP